MFARGQMVLRAAVASVLASLLTPISSAESWKAREDVGVAAVDTRTGKVLWEAWRLDEVPAGATKDEKAAVEYLLRIENRLEKLETPLPRVTILPTLSVKDLGIKNPWPEEMYYGVYGGRGATASEGKSVIYHCDGVGVIALDRRTKKEMWRLLTMRYPYRSLVLEAGEKLAFIQIGSDVPATLRTALGADRILRMRGLEPHTVKQRVAAAVLLHHYGDGYLRPELRKTVEKLRAEKIDPDAEPAAKAIEKLLADWPQKRDRQRLLPGCVAALLKADEGDPLREFPWPEGYRVLSWCLLQELIYGIAEDGYSRQGYNYAYHHGWEELPVPLSDATKAKLAEHCRQVFAEGPDAEKPFASSILLSTAIGWAGLTDDERKKLFLSSDASAWRWAALTLVKNGRREQLIEWAKERPAEDLLDVIWVLRNKEAKEPKDLAGAGTLARLRPPKRRWPRLCAANALTVQDRSRSASRSARTWNGRLRSRPSKTEGDNRRPICSRRLRCSTPGGTRMTHPYYRSI